MSRRFTTNMKILLVTCLFVSISFVVYISHASECAAYSPHANTNPPEIAPAICPEFIDEGVQGKYTPIISTIARRHALATGLAKRLARFKLVHEVLVIWNTPSAPVPAELEKYAKVLVADSDSLNNKFTVAIGHVKTAAVMTIDDDLSLDEYDAACMFVTWQENPSTLVGPMTSARTHQVQDGRLQYLHRYAHVVRYGASIILTNIAFFHRRYMVEYSRAPKDLLQFVDSKMNCEDILMNYVVEKRHILAGSSAQSRLAMRYLRVMVYAETFTYPNSTFISTRPNHFETRSVCMNLFTKHYGFMPSQHPPVAMNHTYLRQWTASMVHQGDVRRKRVH